MIELKKDEKESFFEKDILTKNLKEIFKKYDCEEPNVKISFEDITNKKDFNKFIRMRREFEVKEEM